MSEYLFFYRLWLDSHQKIITFGVIIYGFISNVNVSLTDTDNLKNNINKAIDDLEKWAINKKKSTGMFQTQKDVVYLEEWKNSCEIQNIYTFHNKKDFIEHVLNNKLTPVSILNAFREVGIKLQVGKYYLSREGKVVKIVKKISRNLNLCQDDDRYADNGYYYLYNENPCRKDLIKEVEIKEVELTTADKRAELELDVGKSYKARNGKIYNIEGFVSGDTYPYKTQESKSFTKSGRFIDAPLGEHEHEHEFDLVEEVESLS